MSALRDRAEEIASWQIMSGEWDYELANELIESNTAVDSLVDYSKKHWSTSDTTGVMVAGVVAAVERVHGRVADSIQKDLEREAAESKLDRMLEDVL